jgi:mono/diheme cytochrome c family protein
MTRKAVHMIVPALVLVPALGALAGGWAVTTVEELPDYVVAGKPVSLTYTVRQHGRTPLDGLRGTVDATFGNSTTHAVAMKGKEPGQYVAMLTLPRPGDWTITVHSGFGGSSAKLVPIRAVDAAAHPPALTDAEHGERLFAAKGCVTCHMEIKVGPPLTGRRYDPALLARFLADPKSGALPTRGGSTIEMPNLRLRPAEIASLVAFINAERPVGGR